MLNKELLEKLCRLVRYDILNSTTTAGSGHPTSCLSAVELMTVLFFAGFLQNNLKNPKNLANDRVIFSKGHAAPLLYALYHAAGAISYEELLTLRKFNSTLEGHPTPRFPFVDVATGSLGQGLSIGVGMALGLKLEVRSKKLDEIKELNLQHPTSNIPRIFVLLGDSEVAEGQVWEALEIASYYKLNNLIGILDVNRLGQRGETMLGWNVDTYQRRITAFGWQTIIVDDGHDLEKVNKAYDQGLNRQSTKPVMIIAKTVKGKGVSFLENKEGWHGKTLTNEQLKVAIKELGKVDENVRGKISPQNFQLPITNYQSNPKSQIPNERKLLDISYKLNDLVSTREAFGDALIQIGRTNSNVVVLDGETSNSTFSNKFAKAYPDRFFEMFIAEQNMVSTALGLSKIGFIPFVSTFSAFLTRVFDQIRMAQYSIANLKIVGSHSGVSIGADGPSQMGLEDISMARSILDSIVFYPSDAVSTFKLIQLMANNEGIFYLRNTREKTPVIYDDNEEFKVGGSKAHKLKVQSPKLKVGVISAGITLFEALKAQKKLAAENIECTVVDSYSIKPLDEKTLINLAAETKKILVVEDHYPYGGLGEAVKNTLSNYNLKIEHLCVKKIPMSGSSEELLKYEEIDVTAIVKKVKEML